MNYVSSNRISAPGFQSRDVNGRTFSLSQLKGNLVWLIFYPTGTSPQTNRHALTLAQKTTVVGGIPLHVVCIFRSGTSKDFQLLENEGTSEGRVTLIKDFNGAIFNTYHGVSGNPVKGWTKFRRFLRNVLNVTVTKKPAPFHFLIAEDGVLEKIFVGESRADHLPWEKVQEFINARQLGYWPIQTA